jgi:hypothetical protein
MVFGLSRWETSAWATATTAVTHIAVVEQIDGKTDDWMEQSEQNNTKLSLC